ncbi:MAG: hypothetical protein HYV07_11180 [Deltaproteobacteria bacterium]|nr:hypothetical protein [Deltaproteobacteria bacterium]
MRQAWLDHPDPDIVGKVRKHLERAVVVRPALPELDPEQGEPAARADLPPRELYRAYYRLQHKGVDPSDTLVTAFEAMWEEAEREGVEP